MYQRVLSLCIIKNDILICDQILCNGTGIGVSYNPDQLFQQRSPHKAFCSIAMLDVDSLYVQELEDCFFNMTMMLNFKTSTSYLDCMFNTPLKPRLSGKDYAFMDYFLPIEINKENITSDIGLLRILHHLDTVVHKDYRRRIF